MQVNAMTPDPLAPLAAKLDELQDALRQRFAPPAAPAPEQAIQNFSGSTLIETLLSFFRAARKQ